MRLGSSQTCCLTLAGHHISSLIRSRIRWLRFVQNFVSGSPKIFQFPVVAFVGPCNPRLASAVDEDLGLNVVLSRFALPQKPDFSSLPHPTRKQLGSDATVQTIRGLLRPCGYGKRGLVKVQTWQEISQSTKTAAVFQRRIRMMVQRRDHAATPPPEEPLVAPSRSARPCRSP